MHKLLQLQLEKSGLSKKQISKMGNLFELIVQAYMGYDKDLSMLDNILDQSSQEFVEVNEVLEEDVAEITSEFTRTQEQLERVVDNVPGVIFETDEEGNFKFLNPSWEKLSGYKVEETLGQHYSKFLQGFNDEAYKEIEKIGCDVSKNFKSIVSILTENGARKWIEINYKTLPNLNKDKPGVIGSLVDVTKLKETELELKQAQEAMKKALLAKDDFLSTMSHEIRTPLNGVIGISNLLLMDEHMDSQKEYLKGLKYSSQHLLALINDILDFNKMEGGKLELEEKDFDFKTLMQSIKRNFKFQANERGVSFKVELDSDIPRVLVGDSNRLSQVLNNLLSNAVKFTHEGEIRLIMENIDEDYETVSVLFQVKDTGIGISKDKQEKIFEKFKQADPSISSNYGGTGLGLAICKKLLKIQNSDLKIKSAPNIGSVFYFVLTFKKSNTYKDNPRQAILLQPLPGNLKGIKILVAEDNKLNRTVIRRFLEKWEVDFDIVDNGAKAVDLFNLKEYDLVLMDLHMPKMNGYEATGKIVELSNAKGVKTPIIALTASAKLDVQFKVESVGMTGFVTKPFDPVKLYNTILEQLRISGRFDKLPAKMEEE